jgi:hypothetical protein
MRRSILVIIALILLVTVTVVIAAEGYVVILKNGHRIRAKKQYEIKDNYAIITLATGTVTSFPLDQIDLVETERYNKQGLGTALTIDELEVEVKNRPTPTPFRSLGLLAKIDAGEDEATLGDTAPPTPTPTPGITLSNRAYEDPRVDQAFAQIFDERKLYQYRSSAGTRPSFYFIQTVTDTQREVFKTLKTVAEAYAIIHELHPEIAPEAVELEMITLSNKPAGTFRISTQQAKELATGATSPEQFYVQYVIF